jgi:trehalose-6-phosphatase
VPDLIELRAFCGEKIVEVKPVWANKGEAIHRLLRVSLILISAWQPATIIAS